MRHHVSLFLTASFLFLSHGVQASSIDDDNASVAQGAAVNAVTAVTSSTSEDLQCYRLTLGKKQPLFDDAGKWLDPRIPVGNPSVPSPQPMTSSQNSGALDAVERAPDQPDTRSLIQKTQQEGNVTELAFLVQTEILELLASDPMGRHNLLQTCRYYRAFAQPVLGAMHPISNKLREDLKRAPLMKTLGEQTGDVGLFMRHQRATFEQCSIQELKEAITSGYYKDTLSSESDHGMSYQTARFTAISALSDRVGFHLRRIPTAQNPDPVKLRLVPLHMPDLRQINFLSLVDHALIIPPKLDHLTNLEYINLGSNKLTKSPDVQRLGKLKVLNLRNNRLTTAPIVRGLSNLTHLDLEKNQITSAPDLTGTQVQEVYLDGNPITTPSTSS